MDRNLINEIVSIIQSEFTDQQLRNALASYHDNDIANSFTELLPIDREKLYLALDKQRLSDIFSYLENPEDFILELDHEEVADIIELMDADDAIDILDELPEEDRENIIELMEQESVDDIKMIVAHDEDRVGANMTTNYISIPRHSTIKQAMKVVIEEAPTNDNIATIFVINDDNTYYGSIDLKSLIIARKDDDLEKITKTSYPVLYANEYVSDVIQKLREYSLPILPVLSDDKRLIGVVTSDDIIEAFEEEFSEDYAKLAGLSSEEELDESIRKSVGKRMPWLITLLVLDVFISLIISRYEGVIMVLPMIVFFQSLILDMAGNVGTQSLGVTIRILSEEKLNNKIIFRLLAKEFKIGFINGLFLSVTAFGVVLLFSVITKSTIVTNIPFDISLAMRASMVVSVSLLFAITVSSLVGALMPIFFLKIKVDPAVASGPFITTINDIVAVVLYYGLALLLFNTFI